jgi:hypothetical protein
MKIVILHAQIIQQIDLLTYSKQKQTKTRKIKISYNGIHYVQLFITSIAYFILSLHSCS